ncbi:MAG: translation initiation factor IF-2 [Tannerella sp.]|jgi:translation initiation factor IF-2|nr:translation initiation factor IF-2 [Tannerella sp.]
MVKLNKILKDLNVGLITVVEFLHKKGFEIESNPNVKISDSQLELLLKEFGKGLTMRDIMGLKGEEKQTPVDPPVTKTPKKRGTEEIATIIPEDIRPKFVTKGKIDIEPRYSKTKPKQKSKPVHKKEVHETKPPVVEKIEEKPIEIKQEENIKPLVTEVPAEKEIEIKVEIEKPELNSEIEEVRQIEDTVEVIKPKTEDKPFRFRKPPKDPVIKVTGKINLENLNQKTSPGKKPKEVKRREWEERKLIESRKKQTLLNKPKTEGSTIAPPITVSEKDKQKKERERIKKGKIDINTTPGTNVRRDNTHARRDDNKGKHPHPHSQQQRIKRPVRAAVNEEDVQKQVRETLARLTSKTTKGKGAKYRRDKRDAAASREREIQEQEMLGSKVLKLTEFVTANDLASMMNVPVTRVISTCMSIGIMVSINQRLDAETINIVVDEFGFTTEYVSADVVEAIMEDEDSEESLMPRPPIVTVMGHVDHGKTSLLDNIRKTNVIAGEAGGITQHIGAYNVELHDGRRITFLDTPGHEAFTAMRARGAKVTDIAIIIVAADDDVMPQTVEAINHASAANVPIVFAINKIDKPHADSEKIKRQLANMNYLVEDWGGKYQSQEISAKQGIGVPELLDKVLLEADLLELKANPDRLAVGSVIESSLDKGRGFVSTVLVSNGTLKQGDVVLAGTHYGHIRAMFNERNQKIDEAGPSEPALILGLNGAPQAGDTFNVLETEQEAKDIANRREQLQRELGLRTQKRFGLEELGRRRALGDFHQLNVIVKGDVDGSIEALSDSLIKLSTQEIQVNVIHKAVGQISESDITLAATADAIIIGFQVRPSTAARKLAENEGVEIRLYSIIYDAINEVRDAMEGMLSPEIREDIIGEVEVQQVFKISKVGTIAGCIVKEGKIKRTNRVRVIRDGIVVHAGELGALKRFKDEVKEAVSGQECGIFINNYNDIQVGDIIEPYDQTEIKKKL